MMKNIMPPINTPDNAFHDGNPATGEQGTIVPGLWLNNSQDATRNIQQELISVLTETGIEIDENANNQLLLAILKLISDKTPAASLLTKGIVQLSSSTTSTSETLATTPKAVKTVNDAVTKVVSDLSINGIGLPSQTSISNFDFQNFVFTSGGNYLAVTTNWLNAPARVSYPTALAISITVDYITVSSGQIGLTLVPNTAASVNFKVYKVLCVGAPGSRVFTVREAWNSANPIPITGGGTGATNAAGAIAALGLGDGSLAPIGVPLPYPQATAPSGYLKCNGSSFSTATYPRLALMYPSGVLPDLRGVFIRGWDDGRNVDAGRALGSEQLSDNKSHNHNLITWGVTHTGLGGSDVSIPAPPGGTPNGGTGLGTVPTQTLTGGSGSTYIATSAVTTSGGSESRPYNIAFNYIVRAL